jgi:hypothetical protein
MPSRRDSSWKAARASSSAGGGRRRQCLEHMQTSRAAGKLGWVCHLDELNTYTRHLLLRRTAALPSVPTRDCVVLGTAHVLEERVLGAHAGVVQAARHKRRGGEPTYISPARLIVIKPLNRQKVCSLLQRLNASPLNGASPTGMRPTFRRHKPRRQVPHPAEMEWGSTTCPSSSWISSE